MKIDRPLFMIVGSINVDDERNIGSGEIINICEPVFCGDIHLLQVFPRL